MITDLRDHYARRASDICNLNYQDSMNWENEFLKRVTALYKGADRVFAVTLSSISDFWVSEQDRQLIVRYLKCQENVDIHRLFVFESPYDLMRYEEVLRANHLAYGTNGSVYITSGHNYQTRILKSICAADSVYHFVDKYFGIWESEISIPATLQGTELSFRQIDASDLISIDANAFRGLFSNLPSGVFKWDYDSSAASFAAQIFSDDVTYVGPVTHLVFMNYDDHDTLDDIANNIIELDRIQREAIDEGVAINVVNDGPWWGINIQSIGNVYTVY